MNGIKDMTIAEAQTILRNVEAEHGTEAATFLRLKMGCGYPIGGA